MFAVFSCFLTEILKNNLLELFFFLLHFYHLIFVHLGAVFRCISFNRVLSNIRGEKSKLFVVNNDSVFLVFFSLVSTGMHKKLCLNRSKLQLCLSSKCGYDAYCFISNPLTLQLLFVTLIMIQYNK